MIAIIPARGNSKGLPGKNIKPLLGKPMIAYTIEAALQSKYISRVIVSTDSVEIAATAKKYGASVPFLRPEHLATDEAKAIDTYLYTVDAIEKEENSTIEEIVVLLPTSPLRNTKDIDAACELFKEKAADSVISYTREAHPVFWHKHINEKGEFEDIFDSNILNNRQDLKASYYPNGAVFIFKVALLKQGQYYNAHSFPYVMPRERSIDIDTIDDFDYAEFLMKKNNDR
ncbi:acylneuraminate cytidylyltransferase family protein [Flavobacterium sp.]|uniref:acylneuraminate cytidylyltransferase family protein n=1 Tax=Flavobacterium sp. TaxID=239 RepID=UPI002FDA9309